MSQQFVLRENIGRIARLTLNDPDKLNALSEPMLDCLQEALDRLSTDTDVSVIIIRGAGRAFCPGHDLKEMQAMRQSDDGGRANYSALFAKCARMMTSITHLPQPVIAQTHGVAVAAGCQLVATCDMAVAAKSTKFGVNGINIGLFCSTPMVALTRNIAPKKAFEMLTTGDLISAQRAEALGLVNQVVEDGAENEAALALAQKLADKLPAALHIGKTAFYEQANMSLDAAYAYTGRVMAENMLRADTAEGVAAFIEKRQPNWPK